MTAIQWLKWDELRIHQMHQAASRFHHIIKGFYYDFDWGVTDGNVVAIRDEDGDIESYKTP